MSIHGRAVRWYRSAFRDRAIAVSTDTGTRHFRFSKRQQQIAACAAAGVSVWALVASTAFVVNAVQSSRQIDDLEIGYANLIVDVNRRVQDAVAISESNTRNLAQIAALQADRTALLEEISALSALAAATETARQDLAAERATLRADIDGLRDALIAANENAATLELALARQDTELARAVVDRDAVSEAAAILREQIADLSGRLADAETRNASLNLRVETLSETIASARRDIATAESAGAQLAASLEVQRTISADLEGLLRDTMAVAVNLSAERDLLQARADTLNGQIAVLQVDLADQQGARAAAESALRSVTLRAADLSTERTALRDTNGALEAQVVRLETDLGDAVARASDLTAERDGLLDTNSVLSGRFALLAADLAAQRAARDEMASLVDNLTVTAVDLSTERNALLDTNGALRGQVGALEARMSGLATYQEETFARLREAIDEYVWAVEQGLAVTGLDIEALIEDIYGPEFYGVGGPLIPLLDEHIAGQPGWIDALESIALTDRAVELRDVANQLPIGLPVDADIPLTSAFGPRRDPLNGGGAMHQGLDFDGDRGDAIHATGPGTVIRADWYSGYGRTVEIDHGFGLVSRYAHLQEILVEEGQPIGYSELIGLMGSSGRTTGSHLHYEVLVNGVPHDPMNFIRAGEHVYEIAATQASQ